jgi:predicted transcriptional regulator
MAEIKAGEKDIDEGRTVPSNRLSRGCGNWQSGSFQNPLNPASK